MVFEKSDIQISSVDYSIVYDKEKKIATITPTIHAECKNSQLLIASINVDDHELRPSLKIVLEPGKRSYMVPYVRIANPMLSYPADDPDDKRYKMTLKLHLGNDQEHDIDDYIKITEKR